MYILKSPGEDTLNQQTMNQMVNPKQYQQDRISSHSITAIAFSIAVSQTVHWVQHLIVWIYASCTAQWLKLHIPFKLCILPVGLLVSNCLFWATAALIYLRGKTVLGAKLKFVLWGLGLLVELVLHMRMESCDWESDIFGWPNESAVYHKLSFQPKLLKALPQSSPGQQLPTWPVPHSNVNLCERLEGITTIILG
ncbi:unnamed protein product, partial [Rhizoctonia solani]